MATVINNPSNEGSGAGTIIGIVIAVVLVALLFIYGLPALRGTDTTPAPGASVNVTLPTGSSGDGGDTGQ
jgi:hypothetical protein